MTVASQIVDQLLILRRLKLQVLLVKAYTCSIDDRQIGSKHLKTLGKPLANGNLHSPVSMRREFNL